MGALRKRPVRLSWVLGIGYAIFVVVFALTVHPIEDNSGVNPELDNYVARAAAIGHGVVPTDRFRPLSYVFCAGIIGKSLGSNYFLGCQVVSLLSGLLFVYCSVRMAKLLLGTATAWVVFPLVAFNSHVLQACVRAASDMLFQALTMLLLLSCVKIDLVQGKRRLHFALLGALFGLAYSTRYTAAFVLPALILFYVVRRKHYSVSHVVAFGVGALAAAAPQLLVNWVQAGSPFANDNWKNMALRYLGRTEITKDYFVSVMIDSPLRFLGVAANDLAAFAQESLPRIFFGELWDKVVPARLADHLLVVITVSIVIVLAKSSRRRRRCGLWLLVPALVSILLGVNLAFFIWPRYVLALVPLVFMYLTAVLLRMIPRRSWQRAAVTVLLTFSMVGQFGDLRAFAANHVRDDLRAGKWLVNNVGGAPVVVGTSLFLGNHLTCPYGYLDSLSVINNRASYVAKVYATIRDASPEYFIANRTSSYGNATPPYLLNAPNDTFPFLLPVKRLGTSVVFKVDHQKFREAAAALARSRASGSAR